MTKDDIIRMAREAGIGPVYGYESIERFAALVAAAERERIADEAKHIIKRAEARGAAAERAECAKVCDEVAEFPSLTPRHCAEAIRAREQQ